MDQYLLPACTSNHRRPVNLGGLSCSNFPHSDPGDWRVCLEGVTMWGIICLHTALGRGILPPALPDQWEINTCTASALLTYHHLTTIINLANISSSH